MLFLHPSNKKNWRSICYTQSTLEVFSMQLLHNNTNPHK